jgi:tRNA(Ile)-lysidine synthetase-like protein
LVTFSKHHPGDCRITNGFLVKNFKKNVKCTKNENMPNGQGPLGEIMNLINDIAIEWQRDKQHFLNEYQGVIVSHSGGADSTALFHVLAHILKPEKNFKIALFHMNFGLRGQDSDADEAFSRELAREYALPIYVSLVSDSQRQSRHDESVQEWARNLRYLKLNALAQKGWLIALGHHLHDVSESVLMRLSRGAAMGQAAGMKVFRHPYWRPMLKVRKSKILEFIAEQNIHHRNDQSNDTMDYARNVIRHQVIPVLESLYPGAGSRLALSAMEHGELVESLNEYFEETLSPSQCPVDFLESLPAGLRRHHLAEFLKGGPGARKNSRNRAAKSINRRQVDSCEQALVKAKNKSEEHSWKMQLKGGVTVELRDGHLQQSTKVLPRKSRRMQQTRMNGRPKNCRFLLGPGASIRLTIPRVSLRDMRDPANAEGCTLWELKAIKTKDKAALNSDDGGKLQARKKSFKSHMHEAGIPRNEWQNCTLMSKNGRSVGIWTPLGARLIPLTGKTLSPLTGLSDAKEVNLANIQISTAAKSRM